MHATSNDHATTTSLTVHFSRSKTLFSKTRADQAGAFLTCLRKGIRCLAGIYRLFCRAAKLMRFRTCLRKRRRREWVAFSQETTQGAGGFLQKRRHSEILEHSW